MVLFIQLTLIKNALKIIRKVKMKKLLSIFILLLPMYNAIASDVATFCLQKLTTLSGEIEILNKEITSCGYNKGLAELEKAQDEQRKFVYDKLADKLVTKLVQNSEETALLATYFNSLGDDLLMKGADSEEKVRKQCSLTQMKNIENCGGVKKGPFYEIKLKLLKEKLNPNKNLSINGKNGLYEILASKFLNNSGLSKNLGDKKLSCPLDGGVSGFLLQSQIDEHSALEIMAGAKGSKAKFESSLDSFAQFKLIKSAGDKAIESFRKYLLQPMPKDSKPEEYIAKFFTDKENQKNYFAPTLAAECVAINENVNKFLCSDLEDLGSVKNEVSSKLFNKLEVAPMDDQYEIDFDNDPIALRAYGFQCLSQAKNKEFSDAEKKEGSELDRWYADFTRSTRPELSNKNDQSVNEKFCADYTCSTEDSKKASSCKTGGPLTSIDLSIVMECPLGEKCISDVLKSIEYLSNLEKLKTKKGKVYGDYSNSQSTNQIKEGETELPDFVENYLGVEGSLFALGLPVTDIAIAEKKDNFKSRGLSDTPPQYQTPQKETAYAKNNNESKNNQVGETTQVFAPIQNYNYDFETRNSAVKEKIAERFAATKKLTKASSNDFWGNTQVDPPKSKKVLDKRDLEVDDNLRDNDEKSSSAISQSDNLKSSIDKTFRDQQAQIDAAFKAIDRQRNELASQRDELASQKAEFNRRLNDLEREELEDKNSSNQAIRKAEAGAIAKDLKALDSGIAQVDRKIASVASSDGLVTTPEKLKKMNEKDLIELGVEIEESFVIALKVKDEKTKKETLVKIPVIRNNSNGKSFLVPKYDGKNPDIAKAIKESPLFKEFISIVKKESRNFSNLSEYIGAKFVD
jgi:hypothetical protein